MKKDLLYIAVWILGIVVTIWIVFHIVDVIGAIVSFVLWVLGLSIWIVIGLVVLLGLICFAVRIFK